MKALGVTASIAGALMVLAGIVTGYFYVYDGFEVSLGQGVMLVVLTVGGGFVMALGFIVADEAAR